MIVAAVDSAPATNTPVPTDAKLYRRRAEYVLISATNVSSAAK
jgi:hypothetical protein